MCQERDSPEDGEKDTCVCIVAERTQSNRDRIRVGERRGGRCAGPRQQPRERWALLQGDGQALGACEEGKLRRWGPTLTGPCWGRVGPGLEMRLEAGRLREEADQWSRVQDKPAAGSGAKGMERGK